MNHVVYTGVICAGPDRGRMMSQSISSFSYEETSPPLFGPKRTERVTMVLYACGFVRGADNKSIVEYKGIWVPVTWDDQRCISFLINCAASFLQREENMKEDLARMGYRSNATNIGFDD